MDSTHHRSGILKRLRETIEKTKDPETLTKLTAQYVKLNAQKRPRKSEATSPSKKTNWDIFREQYTGSVFDAMTDAELMVHHIVVLSEKKKKEMKVSTKEAIAEVVRSLPENERAAYETLNTEEGKAQITQHQELLEEAKGRARARMGKSNAESLKGC